MMNTGEDILLTKNNARTLLFRNAHDAASFKKEQRFLQKEWNSEEKLFQKQREQMLQRQSHLTEELSPRSKRKQQTLSISTPSLQEHMSPPRVTLTVQRQRGKTFSEADDRSLISDAMKTSLSTFLMPGIEQISSARTKRGTVLRSKTFSAADGRRFAAENVVTLALPLSSKLSSSAELLSSSPPGSPRSWKTVFADSVRKLKNNSTPALLPDIPHTTVTKANDMKQGGNSKLRWKGPNTVYHKDLWVNDDWEDLHDCRYLRTHPIGK